MKRHLAVVVVCGLLAGVASAQKPPPPAKPFDSAAGGFTVSFPSKAQLSSDIKSVATVAGNLDVSTTKAEVSGVVYSVTFTDYPAAFADVTAKTILDGVVRGMKGSDGQAFESDTPLDGVQGRQVTVTAKEDRLTGRQNWVRSHVGLNGRRLVIVMACGDREAMKAKAVDEFLASFAWK